MNILIEGYYGAGNAGDEAILASLYHQIQSYYTGAKVTVAAENPKKVRYIHDIDKVVPRFSVPQSSEWLRAVASADKYLIGGGGLLSVGESAAYGARIFLARLLGCEIHLVAIGAASPQWGTREKKIIAEALSQVDSVVVRDSQSKENLREAGFTGPINVIADPVFALEPPISPDIPIEIDSNAIVVSVRHPPDRKLDVKNMGRALDMVIESTNKDIFFLPWHYRHTPSDVSAAHDVAKKMSSKVEVIEKDLDYRTIYWAVNQCAIVIGMRLHSIIMAATAETPFVGLPYRDKCKTHLQKLGVNNYRFCDSIDPIELSDMVLSSLQNGMPEQVYQKRKDLSAGARNSIKYVKNPQLASRKPLGGLAKLGINLSFQATEL